MRNSAAEKENIKTRKGNVDVLAALLLLCAFAICILSVLMAGTRIYRDLTARDQIVYEDTVRSLYISTKLAQARNGDAIGVEDGSCITILSELGGGSYITRIYCYDGWIRELFTRADYTWSPKDGEKVSRADYLQAEIENGILKVTIGKVSNDIYNGAVTIDGRVGNMGEYSTSGKGSIVAGSDDYYDGTRTEVLYFSVREGTR